LVQVALLLLAELLKVLTVRILYSQASHLLAAVAVEVTMFHLQMAQMVVVAAAVVRAVATPTQVVLELQTKAMLAALLLVVMWREAEVAV
jgi:hypothetical protein